ncbi:MAG: TolC family protein, partial [Elusimicrobia bacterium]|nr:TolC family protein [Elusimicrobiota bacterium]
DNALTALKAARASAADISEAKRELAMLRHKYSRSLLNLLSVTGIELNAIVTVEGRLEPIIKNLDLNQCLLRARQFRPEMQNTQFQEDIDGLMVQLTTEARRPSIVLGLGQEWLGARMFGDESNWFVALNANVPIFDGGGHLARGQQKRIRARETVIRRSQLEDSINLQVRQAFADYKFHKHTFLSRPVMPESSDILRTAREETRRLAEIYTLNKSYFTLALAMGTIAEGNINF